MKVKYSSSNNWETDYVDYYPVDAIPLEIRVYQSDLYRQELVELILE